MHIVGGILGVTLSCGGMVCSPAAARFVRQTVPVPAPRHGRFPIVLFDLDGTLVDTIGLIVASYRHAFLVVLGEQISEDQARAWIGRPLLPVLLEASPEHGHELDRVYREWNLGNTARLIKEYPGMADLVAALTRAGVRCGVVTSKRRDSAELALAHAGLVGSIDILAALEDTERHKPDPEPLRHAAALLGATCGSCVYVGDATVDMRAARAAGMATVGVSWGAGQRGDLIAAGADEVVDTVGELAAYLLP